MLKRYTLKKPKPIKNIVLQKAKDIDRKVHPDEIIPLKAATFRGKKLIAIGSSTGGVESLLKVFKGLTNKLPPIVITQHIPYGFSKSFADFLTSLSSCFTLLTLRLVSALTSSTLSSTTSGIKSPSSSLILPVFCKITI